MWSLPAESGRKSGWHYSERALKTSVVICTHNRCELLGGTLESLAAMDLESNLNWEICVVDNNSTDATAETVARHAQARPDLPLRYVREERQGIAFARNAGVTAARGEIIAFVDDDVLVPKSWISVIHAAFIEDPNLAILGGRIIANPETPMPPWLTQLNPAPLGLVDFGDERVLLRVPYLATANCAFRRSAIVAAGMFDVRLGRQPHKLYADEDTEMVARIQAGGGKVVYEPAITARHFVPTARMTKAYFRRWYREKGEGAGRVPARSSRSLFGIAFFEYRNFLNALGAFALNALTGKPTLQQRLLMGYFAGIVSSRVRSAAVHD
jgi:glucosyl-dolichyl phosphate glucuronosyltransferase